MATFVNDTFTGTAGTLLTAHTPEAGGPWTAHPNYPTSTAVLSDANRLRANGSTNSIFYAAGVAASANYEVLADFRYVGLWSSQQVGIGGRWDTLTTTGYLVDFYQTDLSFKLNKLVNGVATLLGTYSVTPTVGQTLAIKLTMVGSAIKVFIDGVERISVTDSSVSAAGRAVVHLLGTTVNNAGMHLDNFSAADSLGIIASPTFLDRNTTATVNVLGIGTAFSGSPFTLSGGSGASIVSQNVTDSTHATLSINAGTASGNLTLTDTGSGSTVVIPVAQYSRTLAAADLRENIFSTVTANFIKSSPFAYLRLNTDATTLMINVYCDAALFTGYPYWSSISLRIDGADYSTLLCAAAGDQTLTVTNLPAGTKTIDIITGIQIRAGAGGLTSGIYLKSVIALGGSTTTLIPQGTITDRLIVYGDSIAVGTSGGLTSPIVPQLQGWTAKLRPSETSLVVEGYGSRSFYDDCSTLSLRNAFVAHLVASQLTVLWMAPVTNDYGLNKWTVAQYGSTAAAIAAFRTAYDAFLDAMHAALPNLKIFVQTPLPRGTETANASGITLAQFRNEIIASQAARASFTYLVNGPDVLTLADMDTDQVHPSFQGHNKYAAFARGRRPIANVVAGGAGASIFGSAFIKAA